MDKQKRGFRVSRELVERMLDASTAGFGWTVARDYDSLADGRIVPVGEWFEATPGLPLADPDFFLSFARCKQTVSAVVAWVKKYGLLTAGKNKLGDPITFEAFLEQVDAAYKALAIYQHVRAGDANSLRDHIERRRVSPPGGPPGRFANYFLYGMYSECTLHADGPIADEIAVITGVTALQKLLERRLSGLRYSLVPSLEGPRPLGGHALVPDWGVPDLLSAAWYQFSLIVADARPLHTCPFCGRQTPIYRSGKKETCGRVACQKANQRAKKQRAG